MHALSGQAQVVEAASFIDDDAQRTATECVLRRVSIEGVHCRLVRHWDASIEPTSVIHAL